MFLRIWINFLKNHGGFVCILGITQAEFQHNNVFFFL